MVENLAKDKLNPDVNNTFLDDGLQAVEQLMLDVVDSDVAVLRDASRHILQAGGKRIRPRLMLLSYAATGGKRLDEVIPVAAAIELVHTASVVHDDINDHGVVRRGRPSVNAIWGRTFALLSGDYLFTKVYELMAPYGNLNVILADATIALVEGETLQASAVKEQNFSRETYLKIIARKTAALFKSATILGAKLAQAPDEQVNALGEFGFSIGMAFQIIDDILDLTADTDTLGKTAGIDMAQGKGIAVAYAGNNPSRSVAVSEPPNHNEADPMTSLKLKMLEGETIAKGRAQAQQLVQLALGYLQVLPDSDGKTGLMDLAGLVLDRDH